jgi:hypothetical protein
MTISPEYQARLTARKGQTVTEATYSVKLVTPMALQYLETSGSLTLQIELFSEGSSWWRPQSYLGIYLERPMRWDNSPLPMQLPESEKVLARVEAALQKLGWRYQFLERKGSQVLGDDRR